MSFFALVRGLQRHPRHRASGYHMFRRTSGHFRPQNPTFHWCKLHPPTHRFCYGGKNQCPERNHHQSPGEQSTFRTTTVMMMEKTRAGETEGVAGAVAIPGLGREPAKGQRGLAKATEAGLFTH